MPNKILNIQKLKELANGKVTVTPLVSETDDFCPTYERLMSGNLIPLASSTSAGIKIETYSVGDSKTSYNANQLVCETDIEISASISLTINCPSGYVVHVTGDGYDQTKTVDTNSVVFTVNSNTSYSINASKDSIYTLNLNPTSSTIDANTLEYTPQYTASTQEFETWNSGITTDSTNKTITLSLTSSTVDAPAILAVTDATMGYALNNSIYFNERNTSTAVAKTLNYTVTHPDNATLVANGELIQDVAELRYITFNVNVNGSIVECNGQTVTVENNVAVITAISGTYNYTVTAPAPTYSIAVADATIGYAELEATPSITAKTTSYATSEFSGEVIIKKYDYFGNIEFQVNLVDTEYTLSANTTIGSIDGHKVLFNSINTSTTDDKIINVRAYCTKDPTVFKDLTVTQTATSQLQIRFTSPNAKTVTCNDITKAFSDGEAIFNVTAGTYNYTVSNDTKVHQIGISDASVDATVTTITPTVSHIYSYYFDEVGTASVTDSNIEISKTLIATEVLGHNYTLYCTSDFATVNGKDIVFNGTNDTTENRSVVVTVKCDNDTSVQDTCTLTQQGRGQSTLTVNTLKGAVVTLNGTNPQTATNGTVIYNVINGLTYDVEISKAEEYSINGPFETVIPFNTLTWTPTNVESKVSSYTNATSSVTINSTTENLSLNPILSVNDAPYTLTITEGASLGSIVDNVVTYNSQNSDTDYHIIKGNVSNNGKSTTFEVQQNYPREFILKIQSNSGGTVQINSETLTFNSSNIVTYTVIDGQTYSIVRNKPLDQAPANTYEGLTASLTNITFNSVNSSSSVTITAKSGLTSYETYSVPASQNVTINGANQTVTLDVLTTVHPATSSVYYPTLTIENNNTDFATSINATNVLTITSPATVQDEVQTASITLNNINHTSVNINCALDVKNVYYTLTVNSNESGVVYATGATTNSATLVIATTNNYIASFQVLQGTEVTLTRTKPTDKVVTSKKVEVSPLELNWTKTQTNVSQDVTVATYTGSSTATYTVETKTITVNSDSNIQVNANLGEYSETVWTRTYNIDKTATIGDSFTCTDSTTSDKISVTSPSIGSTDGYSSVLNITISDYDSKSVNCTMEALNIVVLTVQSNKEGTAYATWDGTEKSAVFTDNVATFSVPYGTSITNIKRNLPETEYGTTEYDFDVNPTYLSWTSGQTSTNKTFNVTTSQRIPYTTYTIGSEQSVVITANTTVTVNTTATSHDGTWEETSGAKASWVGGNSFQTTPTTSSTPAIFTVKSPTSTTEDGYDEVITVSVDGYTDKDNKNQVSLSMAGSGATYIVGYRLVINDFSYEQAIISAQGGDVELDEKDYVVYAVYNTGASAETTSHPQVIERYTLISGDEYAEVNADGSFTFDSRGTDLGDARSAQVEYKAYVSGYETSGDTKLASGTQEGNDGWVESITLGSIDNQVIEASGGSVTLFKPSVSYILKYTSNATATTGAEAVLYQWSVVTATTYASSANPTNDLTITSYSKGIEVSNQTTVATCTVKVSVVYNENDKDATKTCYAYQAPNALESHMLQDLELHWNAMHTVASETLTENGGTKQLYGRGLMLDTYTSTATANTYEDVEIIDDGSVTYHSGLTVSNSNITLDNPSSVQNINVSALTSTDGTNWVRQYPAITVTSTNNDFTASLNQSTGVLSITAPSTRTTSTQMTTITLSSNGYENVQVVATLEKHVPTLTYSGLTVDETEYALTTGGQSINVPINAYKSTDGGEWERIAPFNGFTVTSSNPNFSVLAESSPSWVVIVAPEKTLEQQEATITVTSTDAHFPNNVTLHVTLSAKVITYEGLTPSSSNLTFTSASEQQTIDVYAYRTVEGSTAERQYPTLNVIVGTGEFTATADTEHGTVTFTAPSSQSATGDKTGTIVVYTEDNKYPTTTLNITLKLTSDKLASVEYQNLSLNWDSPNSGVKEINTTQVTGEHQLFATIDQRNVYESGRKDDWNNITLEIE